MDPLSSIRRLARAGAFRSLWISTEFTSFVGFAAPHSAQARRIKLGGKIGACILGLSLVACAEIVGPMYASQLASIDESFAPVTVPDSVAARTDFVVSFHTVGGGCTRVGDTQVTMVDGRTAEVRPFDLHQVNATMCTADIRFLLHTATLRFDQAGIATVRLIGAFNDSTRTITRAVVVR